MMFHQIEFLPIAYFTVVMWVVCAGVLAKLFGPMMLNATSGSLHRILSQRVNIPITGDNLVFHLFEKRALSNTCSQLWLSLMRSLARMLGAGTLCLVPIESFALQKILIPEQYWSGCPPNRL